MSEFTRHSTIRSVVDTLGGRGRELLYAHGYDVGSGFVDVLSQWQSLETAARAGRLRDVEGLVAKLNFDRAPAR